LLQGALAMMEFMKKRRVVITRNDMTMLLLNDDMNAPPEIHMFSPGAAKQLHEIGKELFLELRIFFMCQTEKKNWIPDRYWEYTNGML
jgi:hypothetical protein